MTSAKEKNTNKIILAIAFPFAIIAIILSLTGIVPLGPVMTYGGIATLLFAAIATYTSSKKKGTPK